MITPPLPDLLTDLVRLAPEHIRWFTPENGMATVTLGGERVMISITDHLGPAALEYALREVIDARGWTFSYQPPAYFPDRGWVACIRQQDLTFVSHGCGASTLDALADALVRGLNARAVPA